MKTDKKVKIQKKKIRDKMAEQLSREKKIRKVSKYE